MSFPLVDLASPTALVFEWGWLLVTRANFVVYALLALVLLLGATVRVPGTKRDLERVAGEHAANHYASDNFEEEQP
jgi:hypothetical protein